MPSMRGSERAIGRSYSLPFILAGTLAYFLFSFQGTLEAFRSLQALWHFTNYTVAHSHLTMYGFVAFLIWGSVYGLVPRMASCARRCRALRQLAARDITGKAHIRREE